MITKSIGLKVFIVIFAVICIPLKFYGLSIVQSVQRLNLPGTEYLSRMTQEKSCTFCDIIKTNDPNKIIFEDDDVVVFPDIKPAAPHHYLVVSKEHILDAKHLTSEYKPLVEKMVATGLDFLQQKGGNASDARLGFHWPPFNTISHLHLHVISPQSEMSFISRAIFKPDTWWFVTPDYVLSTL